MVPSPQPENLRRRSQGCRQFEKIRVSGQDRKSVYLRVFPNGRIRALRECNIRDMNRARKEIQQTRDQAPRQILVYEQLHNATRLPTRAAYS